MILLSSHGWIGSQLTGQNVMVVFEEAWLNSKEMEFKYRRYNMKCEVGRKFHKLSGD